MADSDWFEEAVGKALYSDPPDISTDVDITQLVYEYIDRLHTEYAEKYFDVMANQTETRWGFEQRLHGRWGEAFDLFEYFTMLNHQSGVALKQQLIDDEHREDDPLLSALVRLHARACQVSREVLTLMRSGYADGGFS